MAKTNPQLEDFETIKDLVRETKPTVAQLEGSAGFSMTGKENVATVLPDGQYKLLTPTGMPIEGTLTQEQRAELFKVLTENI